MYNLINELIYGILTYDNLIDESINQLTKFQFMTI